MRKITLNIDEEHYLSLVQALDVCIGLTMRESYKIPYPPNEKIARKYGKFLSEYVHEWDRLQTIRAQVVKGK